MQQKLWCFTATIFLPDYITYCIMTFSMHLAFLLIHRFAIGTDTTHTSSMWVSCSASRSGLGHTSRMSVVGAICVCERFIASAFNLDNTSSYLFNWANWKKGHHRLYHCFFSQFHFPLRSLKTTGNRSPKNLKKKTLLNGGWMNWQSDCRH